MQGTATNVTKSTKLFNHRQVALPADTLMKSESNDKALLNMSKENTIKQSLIKEYGLKDESQAELERGLRKAACNNKLDDVRRFIQLVGNIDAKDPSQGKTALHWAVARNHPACVQELLNAGADPTIEDNDKKIPGHYALNEEILKLIKSGKKCVINA